MLPIHPPLRARHMTTIGTVGVYHIMFDCSRLFYRDNMRTRQDCGGFSEPMYGPRGNHEVEFRLNTRYPSIKWDKTFRC